MIKYILSAAFHFDGPHGITPLFAMKLGNWFCFIFLGTLGWGISLFLLKVIVSTITPTEIVLYRMAIGSFSLFLLIILLKIRLTNFKYLLLDGLVLGVFNMTIPFYLTTVAVKNISSSLAAVLNGLTPLMTFIIGSLFFTTQQKINLYNTASILLGLLGIIIINFDHSMDQANLTGLLALLLTTLSYAIAANYVKSFATIKEPLSLSAMAAFISTLILLITRLVENEPLHWHLPQTNTQLCALLWLGGIGTGLSLYLYCLLIKNLGVLTASMITYLMTITGVILGVMVLHESMSTIMSLGCICIVLSLFLVNRGQNQQGG